MWNMTYWLALLERAIKTFAQSLAAVLVVDAVGAPLDWPMMLTTAGLATLASVLTSIASNVATQNGPGLGSAETLNENFPDDPNEFDEDEDEDELEMPEGFDDGSQAPGPDLSNRAN